MESLNAQERIQVGQEVDRVLREVGETVVFDRVDLSGVIAGGGGAVERHAEARQVQLKGVGHARGIRETVEAREQSTVRRGLVGDEEEVHVVLGNTRVCQLLHDDARDHGTLGVAEHCGCVAVGDLGLDRVGQNGVALAHRGAVRRETVGAGGVVERQRVHTSQRVEALGCEKALAEGIRRGGLVEVDAVAVGRKEVVQGGGLHVVAAGDRYAAATEDQADVVGVRRTRVQHRGQAEKTCAGGGDHSQTHQTKRAT